MKYLSREDTLKIIDKLRKGATINSVRNTSGKSVSFIKKLCVENNIPIENRQSRKGQVKEDFLKSFSENSHSGNYMIVARIKQHNIIPHDTCYNCGIKDWLGNVIQLELDHINGNNKDNRVENLRFLCPNCHSQTPTYKGKNINSGKLKVPDKELLKALKMHSGNIRKALLSTGLSPKGGNYNRAYKLLNSITC